MGSKKKRKKKRGCLNFFVFVLCLLVTGFIFYFAYLVVTTDESTDPMDELKKLPEKIEDLIGDLQKKKEGG